MSESFNQLRNQVTVQDGDLSPEGLFDKASAYAQLAQQLRNEWDELTRGVKTQDNAEGMYRTLSSGYRATSRFNRS